MGSYTVVGYTFSTRDFFLVEHVYFNPNVSIFPLSPKILPQIWHWHWHLAKHDKAKLDKAISLCCAVPTLPSHSVHLTGSMGFHIRPYKEQLNLTMMLADNKRSMNMSDASYPDRRDPSLF